MTSTKKERAPHQRGSGKELKESKDAMVTGKYSKEKCWKKFGCNTGVKTGVECGQCGSWFHFKCESTTEEQLNNHHPVV